jgi:hypothetical protein
MDSEVSLFIINSKRNKTGPTEEAVPRWSAVLYSVVGGLVDTKLQSKTIQKIKDCRQKK